MKKIAIIGKTGISHIFKRYDCCVTEIPSDLAKSFLQNLKDSYDGIVIILQNLATMPKTERETLTQKMINTLGRRVLLVPPINNDVLLNIVVKEFDIKKKSTHFVVVVALKGGVGKSTLSGAVSYLLAQKSSVIAIDLNEQQKNLSYFLAPCFRSLPPVTVGDMNLNTETATNPKNINLSLAILDTSYQYTTSDVVEKITSQMSAYEYCVLDTVPSLVKDNNGLNDFSVHILTGPYEYTTLCVFNPNDWGLDALRNTLAFLSDISVDYSRVIPVMILNDAKDTFLIPDIIRNQKLLDSTVVVPYYHAIKIKSDISSLISAPVFSKPPINAFRPVVKMIEERNARFDIDLEDL